MKYLLVLLTATLIRTPPARVWVAGSMVTAAPGTAVSKPVTVPGPVTAALSEFSHGDADTATLEGAWVLQPVLPSDTATGKLPTIKFDLSKGRFSGFTGCNQMSGSFQRKQYMLSFSTDILVTKMICEGYNEKDFVTNLLRVTEYSIHQGVLTLMINKTPISKWIRENTVTAPVARAI